jgi:predicted ATPase
MRDVAYGMVLKTTRRAYHGQVAEWLVGATQASGRSGEHTGIIAEHYELAGELDEAADWYTRSGERAKAQGAPSEARNFLDRAMQLLPATDAERRWRALLGQDEVLATLGETETRRDDDDALVALAQEMKDDGRLAEAYQRQANTYSIIGEFQKALQTYGKALGAARRTDNHRVEALTLGLTALCHLACKCAIMRHQGG